MQDDPTYEDVVAEVREFLAGRLEVAVAAGVAEERVWVDPGIGFGKTVEHNLELLAPARRARATSAVRSDRHLAQELPRRASPAARSASGSAAASPSRSPRSPAEPTVLRVHDVAATVDAVRVADAIAGRRAPLVGADR